MIADNAYPVSDITSRSDRRSSFERMERVLSKGGTMNRFQRFASLLAILLAVSGVAFSQAASSSLQGTITDPSGSAIAGATVTLANVDSKTERTVVTGTQGEYRLLALPSGTFTLTVTAKGFAH